MLKTFNAADGLLGADGNLHLGRKADPNQKLWKVRCVSSINWNGEAVLNSIAYSFHLSIYESTLLK